ncbi:MAG: membrane dipeptidase, partial [Myxococcales bacterium]|nr:membrane dipeptidase [Myxococcales bacterium]
VLDQLDPLTLLRITLVHLTDSNLGCTSSPARWSEDDGLRPFSHDCIAAMNDRRVLVDLAHISRKGFFDAAQAHRRDLPFVVTHTGVEGVYPHWRNLTDEQIRAVADSGGFVGIMYEIRFLGPGRSATRETIVDHLEHVIRVGGEHLPALGSDWDGCILTPPDMRTAAEFPLLVDSMLKRGWSTDRIERILGGNALGVIEAIRG